LVAEKEKFRKSENEKKTFRKLKKTLKTRFFEYSKRFEN